MNKPQSNPSRGRLQELRAIPERDRTEAEWDELNELEIMLAAENRQISPIQQQPMQPRGGGGGGGGGAPGQNRPKGPPHGQQQPGQQPGERKFHKRPRRRKTP
jgi:hypothetical protein